MKNRKLVLSLALILFVASGLFGCSTMRTPAGNMIDIKTTDFSKKMKQGEACATYVFGIIGPFGNSSIIDATKSGGISKVEVVDYKDGYYILFSQHCVVAHGN